jgi:hypothetical protein
VVPGGVSVGNGSIRRGEVAVYYLDRRLQHGHWKVLRRIGGEPEAEGVHARILRETLSQLVQPGHPRRGQVAVLQHHPRAVTTRGLDRRLRLGALALP